MEDFVDIGYSDGEAEDFLLDLFRQLSDDQLGPMSESLERSITDWPTEYHLSRQRHCLLRPLRIGAGERVLEIGSGCGAMTRYLGETGAQVIALEGSLRRATITAERCRDLPNVKVIAGNFGAFPEHDEFDWIISVGVLEYANLFMGQDEPARRFLAKIRQLLSPRGQVVLAIENQFGLKYWAGASEDHVGRPYFGVEGRYSSTTATTYGRRHLEELLRSAGFTNQELLLPYPDYKLPTTIIRARALADGDLSVASLVHGLHSRDYGPTWYAFVDEHRVYGTLQRNGLIADLSNSFLVVASPEGDPRNAIETADAWIYSVGRRFTRFAKQVAIGSRAPNGRSVHVERLAGAGGTSIELETGMQGTQVLANEPFHSGDTEAVVIHSSFGEGTVEAVAEAFLRWARHVLAQARLVPGGSRSDLADWVVDGDLLDLIPKNIVFSQHSGPQAFDLEWCMAGDIPLGWLLHRGVEQCRRFNDPNAVMVELCRRLGLNLTEEDITRAEASEREFQRAVSIPTAYFKAPPINLQDLEFQVRTFASETDKAARALQAILQRRIVRVGLATARWFRPLFALRRLVPRHR